MEHIIMKYYLVMLGFILTGLIIYGGFSDYLKHQEKMEIIRTTMANCPVDQVEKIKNLLKN